MGLLRRLILMSMRFSEYRSEISFLLEESSDIDMLDKLQKNPPERVFRIGLSDRV